jgi:hypothetical protein
MAKRFPYYIEELRGKASFQFVSNYLPTGAMGVRISFSVLEIKVGFPLGCNQRNFYTLLAKLSISMHLMPQKTFLFLSGIHNQSVRARAQWPHQDYRRDPFNNALKQFIKNMKNAWFVDFVPFTNHPKITDGSWTADGVHLLTCNCDSL